MTGTAETEAAELHQIYKLDVVTIPTNRPNQREDLTDLVYKTQEAKFAAVVDDIVERVAKNQPVLVGTTSVERSEYLSQLLQRRGVKHHVLNAKHHEQEAEIVAQAGLPRCRDRGYQHGWSWYRHRARRQPRHSCGHQPTCAWT